MSFAQRWIRNLVNGGKKKGVNILNSPLRSAVGSEGWADRFITQYSNNANPQPHMHCVDEHLIQHGVTFCISVNVPSIKKKKKKGSAMMQTKTTQLSLDVIFFTSPPSLLLLLLLK